MTPPSGPPDFASFEEIRRLAVTGEPGKMTLLDATQPKMRLPLPNLLPRGLWHPIWSRAEALLQR